MSFAGELKGFVRGFKAGSDILYRNAARQNIEKNLPLFGPEDYRAGRVPGFDTFGQPQAGTGVGGGAVGTTTAPSESGSQFGQSAYAHYRQKGLSHAAAAGIVGNLMQESGGAADVLNGKRRGDAGASAYAAQWQGKRLTNLEAFAKSRGHDIPTVPDQLDFVLEEMNPNSPYVDTQAAKMFPALQGAASVEQATRLFAEHFERASEPNMPNRIKYASAFGDTGGGGTQFAFDTTTAQPVAQPGTHVAASAQTDSTQTGAIPEEEPEEEGQPLAESPTITTPEVDLSPQVQETPQVDEDEDERRYAMGGAIPDDENTQYFQMGGIGTQITNKSNDPYNPNRAYTQMAGSGYTPPAQARRITLPSAGQTGTGTNAAGQNWRDWGEAGTPNQQKLRNFRAEQEAAAKAKAEAEARAAAEAAARAAQQQPQQQQPYVWSAYRGGPQGKETFQTFGDFFNTIKTGQRPPRIQSSSARYGSHAAGGMVQENYARGGTVAKKSKPARRDTRNTIDRIDWAEANRRAGEPSFEETLAKYQRPGSRGDPQEARDRAAREMNARAGRPSSTAWREPYLRPTAAPAPDQARPAPPVQRPRSMPTPTPAPRDPVTGGAPDEGRMPQVNPMGDVVAPEAGRPYPEGFATPGEASAAIKQDPGWAHVQKMQEQYRLKAQQPQIDVPPVDPNTGEPLETQPAMAGGGLVYARGGAIPDDDQPAKYARGGRAEEAGYTTSGSGRRSSARKKDPWAGLRTKTSKKVRKPSTDTVKRGAAKRKKKGVSQPGRQRRQGLPEKGPIPPERQPQLTPERGPIPPARPPREGGVRYEHAPTPEQLGGAPTPPTPGGGQAVIPGVRGAVPGTDVPSGGSWVDIPPRGGGAPRPQQGPPNPADAGGLMQPIGTLGPARQPFRPAQTQGASPPPPANARVAMPPREVDPNSEWLARDEAYKRRIMEDMRVRGGPGNPPPATRSVRPASPGITAQPAADRSGRLVPAPAPERFGRPSLEPSSERFGGPTPARFGYDEGGNEPVILPEEYYEEQMAYARGGVIPDDTDTPFRQRAGGRGGLQLRFPSKRRR